MPRFSEGFIFSSVVTLAREDRGKRGVLIGYSHLGAHDAWDRLK
jgi:hypothetical protein